MSVSYVSDGGPERWEAAAALHGESFKTDPAIRYLLHQFDGADRDARIVGLLQVLMKFSANSGGSIFDEAWAGERAGGDDPKSAAPPACGAVWIAPRCSIDSVSNYLSPEARRLLGLVGLSGVSRMIFNFQRNADKAKARALRNADGSKIKDYYYLFFISTAAEQRGKGISSELIRRFQAKATEENIPIWLESTTEGSHRLYQRLGFKDQTSWVLGEGQVDQAGIKKAGGSGVRLWAMLWRPDASGEQTRS